MAASGTPPLTLCWPGWTLTRPSSTANGPTPEAILPQFPVKSSLGDPIETCTNVYSTSMSGLLEGLMTATFEVVLVAPATPFSCLGSPSWEPIAARITGAHCSLLTGRSRWCRKRPFEVPALIHTAGIVCRCLRGRCNGGVRASIAIVNGASGVGK